MSSKTTCQVHKTGPIYTVNVTKNGTIYTGVDDKLEPAIIKSVNKIVADAAEEYIATAGAGTSSLEKEVKKLKAEVKVLKAEIQSLEAAVPVVSETVVEEPVSWSSGDE